MNIHQQVRSEILTLLANEQNPEITLRHTLRLLAKYRSLLIQNTLIQKNGTTVQAGPFAGMNFVAQSAEGCHIPKLLGCYEEELHPFLYTLAEQQYDLILNIGCAEGYYAVGMKKLSPHTQILAFDINPIAQKACADLAAKNSLEIEIGSEFKPEDFSRFVGKKVLIWCDIEGAERELLNPEVTPALKEMDLVVEFHPTPTGHTTLDMLPKFQTSHSIEILQTQGHRPILPDFFLQLDHLDQLLAQWEWRSGPTPWAIMKTKQHKSA